ncbi:GNAT family N-acetyltransferase [Jeotgalibacillus sp. R-1-5s-1]|uniref:GNAT family N-acetyltransferase n=1 Tax=Jeotgalibacillus sp. R-1-5s-1 TaxID=2555897 RepID=UPI00106A7450|nr:GNAT family protein [Jeotgalibacillus sp. R-1-5s-1]TFD94539.1 N-acetyltransferase [Jeotgalibacillus sp. R-1-5s-1]
MMIKMTKFQNEQQDLLAFMTDSDWPYHVEDHASESRLAKTVESGWYTDRRETFWVMDHDEKIGLLVIHDIDDTIPVFDLRLAEKARGKGTGSEVLEWLKTYLFDRKEPKIRIEAYTRVDNIGMRKAFSKSGFVKEGYLRDAWEGNHGELHDALCYSAIRSDWQKGTLRPIKLNEEPF